MGDVAVLTDYRAPATRHYTTAQMRWVADRLATMEELMVAGGSRPACLAAAAYYCRLAQLATTPEMAQRFRQEAYRWRCYAAEDDRKLAWERCEMYWNHVQGAWVAW